ncbi:hypothetical protein CGRA01v4_01490 [Colletotrichum graminicola]|nr:hypothetical protein CGRA01v4_01490 [Colletotrichum graminicola]
MQVLFNSNSDVGVPDETCFVPQPDMLLAITYSASAPPSDGYASSLLTNNRRDGGLKQQ